MLIEFEDAGQAISGLLQRVEPLEVLREVVKDEVFFENGNDMPLLVVHDIRRYL